MNTNRDEILKAAAHGNAAAQDFLRAFATRAHWVDDLADGDSNPTDSSSPTAPPTASKLAEMEGEWLLTISGNPFFLANRAALVPAMLLALNAWVDSEAMPTHDVGYGGHVPSKEKLGAQAAVKGQWHEVVWLVAWLTGGWQHLRATSREFRAYDFEAAVPPAYRESAQKEFTCWCGKTLSDQLAWRDGRDPTVKFCGKNCATAYFIKESTNGTVRS